MQHSPLLVWSQRFFLIGLALALVFVVPVAWFPLQLAKVALFSLCLLVAVGLYVAGGGLRELVAGAKGVQTALLVGLLPLVYLVSWFCSVNRSVGLSGFSVETDTVLFTTLAFLAFFISSVLFHSTRSTRTLLAVVAGAAGVAALFQYIVIVFGTSVLPFSTFANRSVNLVGKWNDLGLLVGLGLLLLLTWVEFFGLSLSLPRRVAAGVAIFLMGLLLVVVQFPLVWSLLLFFCLLLALWSFLASHNKPWLLLAGALAAGLFLLWGSVIGGGISSVFPVSSLEVRPAFSSTLGVIRDAHGSSAQYFLLGTGPGTFSQDWLLHKPQGVNQSQFWNLDFNVGFSTFMTALASVGVLGIAVWLVPFVLVLLGALRIVRIAAFSATEKIIGLSLGLTGVYLWSAIFLYVPSNSMILLAFVLSGATLGFSMRHSRTAADDPSAGSARLARLLSVSTAAACLVLVLYVSTTVARRALAEGFTNQGLLALSQQHVDAAVSFAASAQKIETTGNSLLLAATAGNLKLQQMAASTNAPSKEQQAAFTEQLQSTIRTAQHYIAMNPKDYRGYLSLANTYNFLASLGVQNAYDSAKQVYQTALQYNPMDPEIPLAEARLEIANKNNKKAEEYVLQALTLKPDYTDAILLAVQLSVANKDLAGATRAAQAAVQSAPGVPSIWFELGLLYYTQNDMTNAIAALERAVAIQSDYANAKYFLGLSYAAVGRTQDALQQFVDLQKTNPNNSEVAGILQNLQQGKKPFDNAQPPVSTAPQKRATAPISQ